MEYITGYELRKDGYIEENGKEHFDQWIFEAKTKQEVIDYAIKKKVNPDEHFITTVGIEIINGINVPTTFGKGEYLNIILNTHGN